MVSGGRSRVLGGKIRVSVVKGMRMSVVVGDHGLYEDHGLGRPFLR